jgi:TolB-like protein/Flp pilus assembly protein TadD
MALSAGERLGPYEIVAALGSGGMGEVYRARDQRLGREVALKVLPPEVAASPDRLRRFEQEARAASSLSHPNLLAIFDIGERDGLRYLVTELLEGETLRDRLDRGPMSATKALELVLQLGRGLAAAHERGIVHRDLKPENVFVTRDGHLKILDFGLAKVVAPEEISTQIAGSPTQPRTEPGLILGTVAYMAPEQVRGQPADPRSDIFAVGAVLVEMVTGRAAFRRDSAAETMAAILKEEPPRFSASGLQAPPSLERIVRRCLAKSPSARYPSARALVAELDNLSSSSGIRQAASGTAPPSIAVLPFADMSPARDQDYFCEGMAEELIHELARLPGLRVASRTAAFQFKGHAGDMREVGERLGVESVLEGSVRKSGERLRITLQLVDVASGYQQWTGRYDRELADVFAVQEEIALAVAQALRGVLAELERKASRPAPTQSVEAYECYLRGRQFFYRFDKKSLLLGAQMFRRAAEIDPEYALAYAGLADCAAFLHGMWMGGEEALAEANAASRRALELAPSLSSTHASRGLAHFLSRRYDEAQAEFETALQLDPTQFEALYFYARMRFEQARLEQAAELFERAMQARPEDYQSPVLLGMVRRALGQEDESLLALRRGLDVAERHITLNPDDARALYLGGLACVRLGERERGLDWATRALQLEPDEPVVVYNVAGIYALAGEKEKALDCLERCMGTGFGRKEWLAQDSDFESLRGDPRFQRLIAS